MPGENPRAALDQSTDLPARLPVHWPPGIPHALRGGWFMHDSRAMRRGNVKLYLIGTNAPHSPPSSPGFDRATQYSEAPVIERKSCGVLDTPLSRGMTTIGGVERRARLRNYAATYV